METILLTEPTATLTSKQIKAALGINFLVYQRLMNTITGEKYHLQPQWHYYRDGKAWLCKVQHKKKTVFWLSLWEHYFKVTFYFTAKAYRGVAELDINEKLKKNFAEHQPDAKLSPFVFKIDNMVQLKDVFTLIDYKIALK
ncbi:MAG: DUF3788 family protein [Candidatus Dadabacteria bacterium]